MSKIILAKKKLSRKYGVDLHGVHRSTRAKKPYLPGMHGPKLIRKNTVYGVQLRAKQILKFYYMVSEKYLKNLVIKASSMKGSSQVNLAALLECRIDAVVYRSGFAPTISTARQLVSHCHVEVNGKVVNIPSYNVQKGDVISLRHSARKMAIVLSSISSTPSLRKIPSYLSVDNAGYITQLVNTIEVSEIPYDCEMKFNFVIEFYNR